MPFVVLRNLRLKYPFFDNVFKISSGTAVAQLIVLLSSLIIARVYTVEDFGYYQYYLSILAFLITIGCLKYDYAVLVSVDEKEAAVVITLCFIIISSFFLFLLIAILFISYFHFFQTFLPTRIVKFFWVLPFTFYLASVYQLCIQLMVRFSKFGLISSTKIFQNLSMCSVQCGYGLILKNSFGLFIGDLAGKASGIFSVMKWARTAIFLPNKTLINKIEIKKIAIKYKKFALYNTPGTILNTAAIYFPNIILATIFGYKELGFYTLANTLYLMPTLLITSAIGQVYTAKAREILFINPSSLLPFFKKIVINTAVITLVPLVIFALYAPSIIVLVFGKPWEKAGIFASLLSFMQFFSFIYNIVSNSLILMKRQKIQFVWDFSRFISIFIFFYFIKLYNPGIEKTILYFSIIMGIFYFIHIYISFVLLNKSKILSISRV